MPLNGLFLFCVSKVLQFACHFFAVCVSSNNYVKYYSDFGDYTRTITGLIVIGVVVIACYR